MEGKMMDAISRSALIEFLKKEKEHPDNLLRSIVFLDGVLSVIDSAPALDVAPVVHARWIDKECEFVECSSCGEEYLNEYGMIETTRYCPNCGARMDGDTK